LETSPTRLSAGAQQHAERADRGAAHPFIDRRVFDQMLNRSRVAAAHGGEDVAEIFRGHVARQLLLFWISEKAHDQRAGGRFAKLREEEEREQVQRVRRARIVRFVGVLVGPLDRVEKVRSGFVTAGDGGRHGSAGKRAGEKFQWLKVIGQRIHGGNCVSKRRTESSANVLAGRVSRAGEVRDGFRLSIGDAAG